MTALLGDDTPALLAALDQPRSRGLRINPAKADPVRVSRAVAVAFDPVPWCDAGLSWTTGPALGSHPAHVAGAYYLQEPSAMLVAQALDARPGWVVADLAAAPGGKTTHLAGLVGPDGLVLANEVVATRLRTLHDTLDRWGGANTVTTGLRVADLATAVAGLDGVVLDAPCSGEGLFRRRPAAMREWSPSAVSGAARRQGHLLADAARMVRPGGVLVYSTCTFNREENEDRISAFLDDHPGWTVEPVAVMAAPGVGPGLSTDDRVRPTARIWPQHAVGEGQYVARLRSPDDGPTRVVPGRRPEPREREAATVVTAWETFRRAYLSDVDLPEGELVVRGDTAYLAPDRSRLRGLPLARPGLPLGRARPGRFEPAHALAATLTPGATAVHLDEDDGALAAYLRGNTVERPGPDGWVLLAWRGWTLGWGRRAGGVVKNHLPDHLRRLAG